MRLSRLKCVATVRIVVLLQCERTKFDFSFGALHRLKATR